MRILNEDLEKFAAEEHSEIALKVRNAQIQQLYRQTWAGLTGTLGVALSICFVLWHVVPHWKLSLWAGLLSVTVAGRGLLNFSFQQNTHTVSDFNRWATRHVIGVALSGLMWGLPSFFLWPADVSGYQLVWPIWILPLSAAGVVTYYTWKPSYLSFLILSVAPISLRFFAEGGLLYTVLGLLALFYIAILAQAGNTIHAASLSALEAGFHNEALSLYLAEEKAKVEELSRQQSILERERAEAKLSESKLQLRTILQTAMDGFWLMDMQGHILDVNTTICRMSGYTEQELLTKNIADLEVAATALDNSVHFQKVMTTGEDRFEAQLRHKDGRMCDVEVSAQYRPLEGGRIVAFLRDITDRKQADERIADAMNYIQTILLTSPVGIETFKATGETVSANEAAARILGATIDSLKRQNFRGIESWRRHGLLEVAERALATGLEQHGDYHVVTTFGKQVEIDCLFVPFMFGGEQHLMLAMMDISERQQLAKERDHLIEQLISEQNLFTAMNDSLPGIFYVFDSDGHYVRWNRTLESVTGKSGAEIALMHPTDFLAADDRPLVVNAMATALAEGQATMEATMVVRDGGAIPYLFNGRRVTFEGRTLIVVIGVDISSIKAMEEELGRHRHHLEELVEQRTTALTQATAASRGALSLVEATLEATDNGILVIDGMGKISLANKVFARMWNIPDELIASEDDQALLAHVLEQLDDPGQFLSKVEALYHTPEATSRDTLMFRDGRVFARFSHPQWLGGSVVGRVWSFLDISDQYQAEQRVLQLSRTITEELERSEHQRHLLQALLSAIPDLVWMKDPEGVFLSCNPAFGRLMGAPPPEILGKTDRDFFPAEVAEAFRTDDRTAAESPTPVVVEEWVTFLSDGHRALLETVKTAVRGQGGNLLGVLGIARDITRMRTLMEELDQARRDAQHANATKSLFLANMSHEIRTPMNAIIGMAYLALKSDLTPRQRDYIGKMHHAAQSLLVLLNDILDFSKVEAGRLELEHSRFNLEDVVGNSMTMLSPRAQEKELELLLDLTEPLLLDRAKLLIGDAYRLGQIVTNLLSNAVKFTHQGYVKLTIRIEAEDGDTITFRFSVTDSGIGMTHEQVANLFQVFTQADGSTTRKYGGTGLGLTIAKKLVELMEGAIRVESAIEQGSCFTFTARFALARSGGESSPALIGHDRMRALVVDDNPEARQVLCGLLTAMGIGAHFNSRGIESAAGGAQALQMVQTAEAEGIPYNLLLLDWVMPDMDGARTLKALGLAEPAHPPLVVVVSAYNTDAMHETARRLWPASRFLPKPVLPEMLYGLLREMTGEGPTPGKVHDETESAITGLGGMRVLVVEDNPINRQLAVELLELRGVTVDVAHHGGEALETMAAHLVDCYDLILMDLQMPVMDGYETVHRLRMDRRYDTVPIVAMSAHVLAEERERCTSLGMQDHVCKPIEPDALYAVLSRYYSKGEGLTAGSPRTLHPGTKPPTTIPAALLRVKGLEMGKGLRHSGNKVDIYLTLLRCFLADHADDPARIRTAMAEERWGDAERIAHTLKGLIGNIGASEAWASAETLEHAIRERHATWEECLTKLSALFIPLVSALSEHFPAQSDGGDERPGGVGSAPLPSWFDEFEFLLDAGDFHATTLWETGKTELTGLLSTRTISRISSALDNFDFAGAKLFAADARLVISGNPREDL